MNLPLETRSYRLCARRLFGVLWAGPLSLVGLALAAPVVLSGGTLRAVGGRTVALLVEGPLAGWLLRRHPAGAMNAMAIGHVIVIAHARLAPRVLWHELEHVRQAERWGLLFPFAYLGSSLWQLLRGRRVYLDNHFEVAARAAENEQA